jgi:tetratricopeptide (TPR) repeat protein
MSYEYIKNERKALLIWGVMSYLPGSLSQELLKKIFEDDVQGYISAAEVLIKNGLVTWTKDRPPAYSMLAPIKNTIFRFDDSIRVESTKRLREAFVSVFPTTYEFDHPEYNLRHHFALDRLPLALAFLNRTKLDGGQNKRLIYQMRDYFQFASSTSLATLRSLDMNTDDADLTAYLFLEMGILEERLGLIDEAKRHFKQAENLYSAVDNNIGLANVLQFMGDLEFRMNQFKPAENYLKRAEELFRNEQDLGLANVLCILGDLERMQFNAKEAEHNYTEAKKLYLELKDNLGLANVYQGMGYLEYNQNNMEPAERYYRLAEGLYRTLQENIGLANAVMGIGDIERINGNMKAAEGYFRQAEELFRTEQDNLGLADVFRSKGDLERHKKNYTASIKHYQNALPHYENEQELQGKSYTMAELCRAYALAGKPDDALKWLQATKDFYPQIPEYARPYVDECINEAEILLGKRKRTSKNKQINPLR